MSVTILLTLWGRPHHTLRWFWHAERTRLPFPVLVADGGDDPEIERLLSDPSSFPHVDYTYLRYHDHELKDFWYKLADASARIQTPYAMMSDNDDFPLSPGISAAADFLDRHPNYVAAGGPQFSFGLRLSEDGVAGTVSSYGVQERKDCFGDDNAVQRIASFWRHRSSFYYDVIRSPVLHAGFSDTLALNFAFFDVWENFLYQALLLRGKVKSLPLPPYLRQLGSSQAHALGKGWLHNLFHRDWMTDFEKMRSHLSATVGPDGDTIEQLIRDGMISAIRTSGVGLPTVPTGAIARHLRDLTPLIALNRWRRRHAVNAVLRHAGASPAALAAFNDDLDQTIDTLKDPALSRFIGKFVS